MVIMNHDDGDDADDGDGDGDSDDGDGDGALRLILTCTSAGTSTARFTCESLFQARPNLKADCQNRPYSAIRRSLWASLPGHLSLYAGCTQLAPCPV